MAGSFDTVQGIPDIVQYWHSSWNSGIGPTGTDTVEYVGLLFSLVEWVIRPENRVWKKPSQAKLTWPIA